MIIATFKALGKQLITIAVISLAAALIARVVGGQQAAADVLNIGIAQMKGPWVWTFGYGLASLVMHRGRLLPLDLNGIFQPSPVVASAVVRMDRSTRHKYAWKYTVPITILGGFLTAKYQLPTSGIAYGILFVMTCSIYYIAAFLLFNFVETTLGFDELLESERAIEFRRLYNPMHLENITSYLAITTALGLIGIYAGFRGTLTTAFRFDEGMWKTFLAVPLALFLPGALFYNYYPRYVLRKILQHKVFRTMTQLGEADDLLARSLVLDLKEAVALNSQILAFLDYKSLPAYLLAISFGFSLAYNSDPAVKAFIGFLLNLGSR